MSSKSVLQECQVRSVLQECLTRVSSKSCSIGSSKGVLQECHLSVWTQDVSQVSLLEMWQISIVSVCQHTCLHSGSWASSCFLWKLLSKVHSLSWYFAYLSTTTGLWSVRSWCWTVAKRHPHNEPNLPTQLFSRWWLDMMCLQRKRRFSDIFSGLFTNLLQVQLFSNLRCGMMWPKCSEIGSKVLAEEAAGRLCH